MPTASILLTGATGFIGRRLISPATRVLVRQSRAIANEFMADLSDENAPLREACQGVDTVIHCAGYAHAFKEADPRLHWQVNFEGTMRLAHAATQAGVKQFIFLSSVKAFADPYDDCVDETFAGQPTTAYGIAKLEAERALTTLSLQSSMAVTHLRLAMVYGQGGRGNLERMAHGVRAGWFPALPQTHNRRSLVHVEDVVAAIRCVQANVATANRQTYIVSHPQPVSGYELYQTICSVLGKRPAPVLLPALGWNVLGALGDQITRLTGKGLPVNSEIVDRLLGSACYSPLKLQTELGWQARVDLQAGLREMLGLS